MSLQESQIKKYLEKVVSDLKCQTDFSKISKSLLHKGIIVDFWIPSLNCVIEVHGIQHYKPSGFGRDKVQTQIAFNNQINRDEKLKKLCIQYNLNYIEIPYTEKVDLQSIWTKLLPLMN